MLDASLMVDPLDSQFEGKTLGAVVKPVLVNSPKPTPEAPHSPYEALKVGDDEASRRALLGRLLDMFCISSSGSFDTDQLATMRAALEKAMPDPAKDPQNFVRFVQDRCHGVLEMLRLLVVMQGKNPQTKQSRGFVRQEIIDEATRLAVPAIVGSGLPKPVAELIGKERDGAMHPRVARINTILAIGPLAPLKAYNREKLLVVTRKFASLEALLSPAFRAFTDRMERFQNVLLAPEYMTAQWLSVLLTKLDQFEFDLGEMDEVRGHFERLTAGLRDAQTTEAFTIAIENFGAPIN